MYDSVFKKLQMIAYMHRLVHWKIYIICGIIYSCRAQLHADCINFNIYVSREVRTVLKIMGLSKYRYVCLAISLMHYLMILLNVCSRMQGFYFNTIVTFHRTQEGFKPFLSSVVKQFLFVQRACGLTREILKCTSDEDW